MKRRDWLHAAITSPALAAAAAAPALAQTPPPSNQDTPKLSLTSPDAVAGGPRRFFTAAEFETLEALAGALVPAVNGRPGAMEAGVPQFLDFLLSQSPEDRQKLYRTGLQGLASFEKLDAAAAKRALAPLQQPWTFEGPADPVARFLRALQDDLLQATVNSREWSSASRSRTSGGTSYYYFQAE